MNQIKIIIDDGIIARVMASDGTEPIEVEIVDYDRNTGNKDMLEERYNEPGFHDIDFSVDHCEEE